MDKYAKNEEDKVVEEMINLVREETSIRSSYKKNDQAALVLGLSIGLLVAFCLWHYWEYLESIQPFFVGSIVVLSTVLGFALVYIVLRKHSIFFRLFNVSPKNYDEILPKVIQKLLPVIAEVVPSEKKQLILSKTKEIETLAHQILAYQVYSRTRAIAIGWLIASIAALSGYFGTTLLLKQNRLIKEQTYLAEASRRSSLVFLMGEILDQVNDELKGKSEIPYNPQRKLSTQTIGRLAALSHSLYPYRFLNGDKIEDRVVSPERGQLLVNLLYLKLDTLETTKRIFEICNFDYADLRNINLNDFYIFGLSMKFGRFENSKITNCQFINSNFDSVTFENAELQSTVFRKCWIEGCSFNESKVEDIRFIRSSIYYSNFERVFHNGESLFWYNYSFDSLINKNLDSLLESGISYDLSFENSSLGDVNFFNHYYPINNVSKQYITSMNFRKSHLSWVNFENNTTEGLFDTFRANFDSTIFKTPISFKNSVLINSYFNPILNTSIDFENSIVDDIWIEATKKFPNERLLKILSTYNFKPNNVIQDGKNIKYGYRLTKKMFWD